MGDQKEEIHTENFDVEITEKEIKLNGERYTRTPIDLEEAKKLSESKEYKELFTWLKTQDMKTGTDIADKIQERTGFDRPTSILVMSAYLLGGNK